MNEQQARQLLERYRQGIATDEETKLVENWISSELEEGKWDISPEDKIQFKQDLKNRIDQIRHSEEEKQTAKVIPLWKRLTAAASIFLAITAGGYLLLHKPKTQQQTAQNQQAPIQPGSKKAILTLSNGSRINLNDAKAGLLAQQGNTNISKTADGQVVYNPNETNNSTTNNETIYNTITTPKGGYYPLKMADGTIAILDAASSIKYPVTFTGKERLVEITGQVYFEVAHNAKLPFKLKVRGQVIEDLGTRFNVNAYEDEPVIKTTLVEGAVKVSSGPRSVTLKPGQQASAAAGSDDIKVKAADPNDAIAWKNGQTSFKNEDIRTIMRQVARWYDVDVKFEGKLPTTPYVGGIARNANLSDLLKVLEFNDVHFSIQGKTITVKP